ncbi:MAG: hypothetical protein KAR20_12125, partial [Candidatus Heimdallarchaeota archaeon]|nr:hypothetical protein [Candidatus Heimdallarchaeota archaeon]
MRKILVSFLIGLFLFAQLVSAAVSFDLNNVRAVINSESTVQVEKNIIFDASQSFLPDEKAQTSYSWDFGDNSGYQTGVEVVHSYA